MGTRDGMARRPGPHLGAGTLAALLSALALLVSGSPGTAEAACQAPTLAAAVDTATPGSHVRVTGDDWRTCVDVAPTGEAPRPHGVIVVILAQGEDEIEVGRVGADPSGQVDATVRVPDGIPAGEYRLFGRTPDESAGSAPQAVTVAATGRQTSRVGGDDRIATSVLVAQRNFRDGAPTAYLARADVPFDAMVGATAEDGPILLVEPCALPDIVHAEIRRLGASEVVALGGDHAVCDEVLEQASS